MQHIKASISVALGVSTYAQQRWVLQGTGITVISKQAIAQVSTLLTSALLCNSRPKWLSVVTKRSLHHVCLHSQSGLFF